jgi:hypothetical protein
MKKTLSKKNIKGHEYYYLSFRKGGKLTSTYLGKTSSLKFKKYLLSLTSESRLYPFEKARKENFKAGTPVITVEEGYLVYAYKNGIKEYRDSKMKVVKVVGNHD